MSLPSRLLLSPVRINYWTLCYIFVSPRLDFSAVEGSAQVLRFQVEITLLLFLAQEKRSVLVVFWILAFLTGNTLYLLYTFSSQQLYNRWAKFTLYRMEAGDNCQGGKEGSPLSPQFGRKCVCLKDLLSLLHLCSIFQCRKRMGVSLYQWIMLLSVKGISSV